MHKLCYIHFFLYNSWLIHAFYIIFYLIYSLGFFCFFYVQDQCLEPVMAEDLFQTNPLVWISFHAGTDQIYAFCVERRERHRIITVNFILAVTTDYIILSSNKSSCIICPHSLTFRKFFCVPGPFKDLLELMAWELPTHHPVQQNA